MVSLLPLIGLVAVVVLLGHAVPVWLVRRVSWLYSTLGQFLLLAACLVALSQWTGDAPNLGWWVRGTVLVALPPTLIALGLRTSVAPWRPDRRLRKPRSSDPQPVEQATPVAR